MCNNDYLQLLCREIIEVLLYRGFPRPNWPAKYHERSEKKSAHSRISAQFGIGQYDPKYNQSWQRLNDEVDTDKDDECVDSPDGLTLPPLQGQQTIIDKQTIYRQTNYT